MTEARYILADKIWVAIDGAATKDAAEALVTVILAIGKEMPSSVCTDFLMNMAKMIETAAPKIAEGGHRV